MKKQLIVGMIGFLVLGNILSSCKESQATKEEVISTYKSEKKIEFCEPKNIFFDFDSTAYKDNEFQRYPLTIKKEGKLIAECNVNLIFNRAKDRFKVEKVFISDAKTFDYYSLSLDTFKVYNNGRPEFLIQQLYANVYLKRTKDRSKLQEWKTDSITIQGSFKLTNKSVKSRSSKSYGLTSQASCPIKLEFITPLKNHTRDGYILKKGNLYQVNKEISTNSKVFKTINWEFSDIGKIQDLKLIRKGAIKMDSLIYRKDSSSKN